MSGIKMANTVNNIGEAKNTINAFTSTDEVKRKLANDRYTCAQKFAFYKLGIAFKMVLLHLLIIFLCGFIMKYTEENSKIYNILLGTSYITGMGHLLVLFILGI